MGKIECFEEIKAWARARTFTKKLYAETEKGGFKVDFELKKQMRKAAISITSNIAEGFERNTDKEFKQFLFIAKASAGEVRSQLYLAYDLRYLKEEIFEELKFEITEISKLISGFIKYLETKNK
nr:four helix bundle protein [Allomuricauda sp.]